MNSVDNRVVQMQFNNQQFESGIKTSMNSLNGLKKGLNLDESSRSLSNLEKVGKSFSLAGIAEGVDTIKNRFSALSVVGVTALVNITNSAINAGKRMVSALTIDPIKMGLSEYETKMGSIQTILTNTASKGTTLSDVNKTLNELNTYADQTIYNFSEMTRNIGTFTAAGIDLKTSATAIKGIANLAAGSGSNAQQASTAMYQLSQAMAAGSVKLQDWNSVVNAGMGGELFQKALEKTATELGKGRNQAVSFRESLQDGWITTEVMTKTLEKFAADESLLKAATQVKTFTQLFDTMKESVQSGWAQSWESIIGDKDESSAMLTSISEAFNNLIGPSTEARNNMLSFWNDNGGRDAVITAISDALKFLGSIIKPITDAFRVMFPATTGQQLLDFSNKLKDFTSKLKLSDETIANIRHTAFGFFAILDIGKQAISAVVKAISSVIKFLLPAGDGFLSVTGDIGLFILKINEALKSSDAFNTIIKTIGDILSPIAEGIRNSIIKVINAFKSLGSADLSGLDSFSDHVNLRFKPLTKLGDIVGKVFDGIINILKKIAPIFIGLGTMIGKAFSSISSAMTDSLGSSDFSSILDIVNGGIFAAILLGIRKFIKSMTDITDNAGGFLEGITDILDGVKGSLEAYQSSIKAGMLLKIAVAIGILAAALLVLSFIDPVKMTSSLAAMTTMFIELFASMAIFQKIMGGNGFKSMTKITLGMIGLSIAILILASAMTKLAKLDWDGITKGLMAIGILSGILIGVTKALSKQTGSMIKASLGFIIFGAALNVLASAVEKLGRIKFSSLVKGLIGVGVLATELALFMKVTDLSGMSVSKGAGLLLLATAISILASAVEKFSGINSSSLIKGLGAMAIVLAEIAIFVNSTGNAKKVISTAIGLTILGSAMLIFGSAIEKIGKLSVKTITKGLIGMAGALTVIAVGLRMMPKNIIKTGVGLTIVAASILILTDALSSMGEMTKKEIAKSLIVLAGSLGVIAIALYAMSGTIVGSAALLIAAGALAILTPILVTLGSLPLTVIGTGLLAMAGAFTVIGIAGLVLGPLVPVILGLSIAIGIFGAGCAAVGVGMLAFSAGLTALSVAGTAGSVALVAVVTALIGLIPMALTTLARGIIDFAKTIGEGAPVILDAFVKIFTAIIDAIIDVTPKIMECLVVLLNSILDTLVDTVPKMVDAGMKLILGILTGIADNIAQVVEAGINVILEFIKGVISKLPDIIDAAFKVIISFINGLADAIRENHNAIFDACVNLVDAIVDSIVSMGGRFVEAGANAVKGFLKGLASMGSSLWEAGTNLAKSALGAAQRALDINSPSREFAKLGVFSGQGFVNGLDGYGSKVSNSASNVGKVAISAMSKAISGISDIVNSNVDINPTIRPVMDLSDVQNGSRQLYSMMDKYNGYTIDGSVIIAQNASNGINRNKIDDINQSSTNNNSVINAIKDLKDTLNNTNGGDQYNLGNITYDDGSNVSSAVKTLVRAARIGRRT